MKYRTEEDSMGKIKVPEDKYYGAQTARSLENFKIGTSLMPRKIVRALAMIKKAAAMTNAAFGDLPKKKEKVIIKACEDIVEKKLDNHFPLRIWQTGSGTHTNMNVNEVVANRAIELMGGKIGDKKLIHPNDDVNMSQSSNDCFPTAMHIAAAMAINKNLLPPLKILQQTFAAQVKKFKKIIKIGRTHLMDATPMSLGQEISAYSTLLKKSIKRIENSVKDLYELALGGTAVGTGINSRKEFGERAIKEIAKMTGLPFYPSKNKFEALSTHDPIVGASGALEILASSLYKIANDIRLLNSGPRCGIGEIIIPANEPGSSIMSGKVNPTQAEAMAMVCLQVKGNHRIICDGVTLGELQLNVAKPLIAYNLLKQIRLLSDACKSFHDKCIVGIKPNMENITKNLHNSLMLVTALNKHIGYDKAAKIAKVAYEKGITLKEAAVKLKLLTADKFDDYVQPKMMIQPE